jgi:hypothetical protein
MHEQRGTLRGRSKKDQQKRARIAIELKEAGAKAQNLPLRRGRGSTSLEATFVSVYGR